MAVSWTTAGEGTEGRYAMPRLPILVSFEGAQGEVAVLLVQGDLDREFAVHLDRITDRLMATNFDGDVVLDLAQAGEIHEVARRAMFRTHEVLSGRGHRLSSRPLTADIW